MRRRRQQGIHLSKGIIKYNGKDTPNGKENGAQGGKDAEADVPSERDDGSAADEEAPGDRQQQTENEKDRDHVTPEDARE